MALDVTKACERELKRFEDLTTRFENFGLVIGFVDLFIAVWVRAPALQMDPGSGIGLAVSGFNVGYAIVYGPIVTFATTLFSLSLLERRDASRTKILRLDVLNPGVLSEGDRSAIGCEVGTDEASRWCDVAWRTLWYVLIPPLAAAVTMRRYFDFVPTEAAKSWSFWERVRYWLFDTAGWETRPILPDHALESGKDVMIKLPYVYPPLGSWIGIALVLATAYLTSRIWRLYANPRGSSAPGERGPEPAA